MAVKQNNNDGSVSPSTGNGAGNSVNGGNTSSGNVSGVGGTKSKKINSNVDSVNVANIDKPGCSGAGGSTKHSSNSSKNAVDMTHTMGSNGSVLSKPSNMSDILHLIEILEIKQLQMDFGDEIFKIYHHLIVQLARVQIKSSSAEELKRFKEDIIKVGVFFGKAEEKRMYLFYLSVVCKLITQSDDVEPPSCAIAVIFQLFSDEMVLEAVESLLVKNIPDHTIRKTVRLLREWLRMCNFCQNLNLWIMAILNGIRDQQKFLLYDEIAMENIEQLFASMILPVLRPKVAPIVFHMLQSISDSPLVFHKILGWFPKVISCLKQQSNSIEEHAEYTKKILQQLVDNVSGLMVLFHDYRDLYEPVERALKDIPPTYNYLRLASSENGFYTMDSVLAQNHRNAKVGLVNLGNTCYMNSVLQALAMTKEFCRQILLSESISPLILKTQQQIALMLYSMRYELTPSRLLNATRPPGFSPGVQQDSSEFLGYLMETLHDQELSYLKNRTDKLPEEESERSLTLSEGAVALSDNSNKMLTSSKNEGESSCSNICDVENAVNGTKHTNEGPRVPMSAIEKTFTGKLATTFKCLTCGWHSRNVDSFRELQLAFPEVKNECAPNYSVQDLLEYYCSPEKLDGENQYFCQLCKKHTDAERYINVIKAPKNLILTLKYFKYDQKYHMRAKLMHKVFHDEKVSVKVCSSETLEEVASMHYDLYAGVVHSGFSMDSGHYYTYAADAPNKWYKFNDNIVTPSKSEELHNLTPPNTPYILFYQMGARSNETETPASTKVIKVDIPVPLTLDELPSYLRDYVNHDNYTYTEEIKIERAKMSNANPLKNSAKANDAGYDRSRGYDDDNDQPPPAGCGGNALNINANRFVY